MNPIRDRSHPVTRRRLLGGLVATAATAFTPLAGATTQDPGPVRPILSALSGPAFGTRWRAVLATGESGRQATAARLAMIEQWFTAILDEIDRVFSPYRQDAELARLNRQRSYGPIGLSPPLAGLLQTALDIADRSDGWFDPTVGPVLRAVGLGPIAGDTRPDYRDLRVRDGALLRARASLTVDLCGIAKGHALDRLADTLLDAGVQHALIELGGEVRAFGRHPQGRAWQVGIADPRLRNGSITGPNAAHRERPTRIVATVMPGMRALATSGLAESVYRVKGRLVHHLIDPRTAAPVVSSLRSVSVLAHDATTADAWATALLAAGDAAAELAHTSRIDCLLLSETPAGELAAETIGNLELGGTGHQRP